MSAILKLILQKKMYFKEKFYKLCDSENVWRTVNELTKFRRKSSTKIPKLVSKSGVVLEDSSDICDELANEFVVKSSTSDPNELNSDFNAYETDFLRIKPDYQMEPITEEEVCFSLKTVKKGTDDNLLRQNGSSKNIQNHLVYH